MKHSSLEFLGGGGEMGERIRAFDWSETALGPVTTWSPSLKMIVRFLLANRFPLLLWWGPEFIQIYNDPYRPVLETKHPFPGLGRPVRECWSEIWRWPRRHVTGAAALYASTHSTQSANQIRQALLQSATPTASLAGKTTTGARLNLAQIIAPAGISGTPTAAKFSTPTVTNGQLR